MVLFISLFGFCFNRKQDKMEAAKRTVMEIFRLSYEKKYDSLSKIMPDRYFKNTTKDYQSIISRPMRQAVKAGDFPDNSNLKNYQKKMYGENGYVLTFYPNQELVHADSAKFYKVDSISFYFIESIGFNKIAGFETFIPIIDIKTLMPGIMSAKDSTLKQ
jgi:hypothetical protein